MKFQVLRLTTLQFQWFFEQGKEITKTVLSMNPKGATPEDYLKLHAYESIVN